jgi:hypothetical protein
MIKHNFHFIAITLISSILCACGGGGSSENDSSPAPEESHSVSKLLHRVKKTP